MEDSSFEEMLRKIEDSDSYSDDFFCNDDTQSPIHDVLSPESPPFVSETSYANGIVVQALSDMLKSYHKNKQSNGLKVFPKVPTYEYLLKHYSFADKTNVRKAMFIVAPPKEKKSNTGSYGCYSYGERPHFSGPTRVQEAAGVYGEHLYRRGATNLKGRSVKPWRYDLTENRDPKKSAWICLVVPFDGDKKRKRGSQLGKRKRDHPDDQPAVAPETVIGDCRPNGSGLPADDWICQAKHGRLSFAGPVQQPNLLCRTGAQPDEFLGIEETGSSAEGTTGIT